MIKHWSLWIWYKHCGLLITTLMLSELLDIEKINSTADDDSTAKNINIKLRSGAFFVL